MASNTKNDNSMNTQSIVMIALVVLLIFASFFIGMLWTKVQNMDGAGNPANGQGANNGAPVPTQPSRPAAEAGEVAPVTDSDWVRGDRNATLALIEYSDFECPFCARFHPTAQQAVDDYDGQVMWVYRHFPLDQLHPNATPFAIASECAGKLGGNDAFWAFADALIEGETDVNAIASDIGLNSSQFQTCYDNKETADLVDEDVDSGTAAGVTGTPGNVLLNIETGETALIPGALPFSAIQTEIDKLLAE